MVKAILIVGAMLTVTGSVMATEISSERAVVTYECKQSVSKQVYTGNKDTRTLCKLERENEVQACMNSAFVNVQTCIKTVEARQSCVEAEIQKCVEENL